MLNDVLHLRALNVGVACKNSVAVAHARRTVHIHALAKLTLHSQSHDPIAIRLFQQQLPRQRRQRLDSRSVILVCACRLAAARGGECHVRAATFPEVIMIVPAPNPMSVGAAVGARLRAWSNDGAPYD